MFSGIRNLLWNFQWETELILEKVTGIVLLWNNKTFNKKENRKLQEAEYLF